ncbi:carbohydrate kinase family protein [Denitrobaculum tricleocarpae]|uniref:Carbohydrate kinase PfkB domain-containing protein n=1 Tax=Denitrobaculum tricleocarpae TaxID=2591009 RepID=A0A545TPI7_9PROT|nr:carbohydrate kinase family protein [Denitrobaculum tricleocarpae]TQV79135.1 hypothetical protein FKG95_15830 [Denitrobaculum tricleocarpae]
MTRVFCFGGAHIDRTARCKAAFVPGASNPVAVETTLGGAALNTAFNLKRFGHDVYLISTVGDDSEGARVAGALSALELSCEGLIHRRGQASANYTAILEKTGDLVAGLADMAIYDGLTSAELLKAVEEISVSPPLSGDFAFLDANLPAGVLEDLTSHYSSQGLRLAAAAISPAKVGRLSSALKNINLLFCNQAELAALSDVHLEDEAALRHAGASLSAEQGISILMTRGANGLLHFDQGEITAYPAHPAKVVDVNGAGDAFAAGCLHALMLGVQIPDAITFGQATACLTLETKSSTASGLTAALVSERLGR